MSLSILAHSSHVSHRTLLLGLPDILGAHGIHGHAGSKTGTIRSACGLVIWVSSAGCAGISICSSLIKSGTDTLGLTQRVRGTINKGLGLPHASRKSASGRLIIWLRLTGGSVGIGNTGLLGVV